jgi:integrase
VSAREEPVRVAGKLGSGTRLLWRQVLDLIPSCGFHDLRHSCAALLIAQGAHPKEIQARLGHASITTTLNTYGHLWPSLGEQLDQRMEDAFHQARANVASMWPEGGSRVVPLTRTESETGS